MNRACFLLAFTLGCAIAQGELTPEQIATLPPAADRPVDFKQDIQPLLEASCINCHGRGRNKGDFQLDTRELLLKGGASGPTVIPGNSAKSYLVELISGLDEDNVMPQKGTRLTREQVSIVRAWIDQGASWPASVSFAKPPPRNLHPRKPELPPAEKDFEHPVDRLLKAYWTSNHVNTATIVDDRGFMRRVYLDLIGLPPGPEKAEQFLKNSSPRKRLELVREVLQEDEDYAQHWLTFWNDALRNDYRGVGYIDGGRKQITGWLFSALKENTPYNKFVEQLINPTEDCEGFTKGIVWRGVVNASQLPPMQAAQNISHVFMGVNIKCASCHDSFINDWRLSDAYGLANVYSDEPLEVAQCDKLTGKKAETRFLYPELGALDPKAKKSERLKQLAALMGSRENGRLSRTIVNRLWARLFGRGLVEPLEDMEQIAWHQDLLDWLAEDLVEHDYDLRHCLERIVTSRAYQLPAVDLPEREDRYVFAGPAVKRLSAEQFRDSLGVITDSWYTMPAVPVDFSRGENRPENAARWIWTDSDAADHASEGSVYFRKRFDLEAKPQIAFFIASCDNSYTAFINGEKAAAGKEWGKPEMVDVTRHLKKGENWLAIEATNGKAESKSNNPAGLISVLRWRVNQAETWMSIVSDKTWAASSEKAGQWEHPIFVEYGWAPAAEAGSIDSAPWTLKKKLIAAVSTTERYKQTRAALVPADPLMAALGRPNREQVVTTRASHATTLQGLELTNGETISKLLKAGAEKLVKSYASSDELVRQVYLKALARLPNSAELAAAQELISSPIKTESVEDLLWAVTMLPEFQLIY